MYHTGYDVSVMGGTLILPSFERDFGLRGKSQRQLDDLTSNVLSDEHIVEVVPASAYFVEHAPLTLPFPLLLFGGVTGLGCGCGVIYCATWQGITWLYASEIYPLYIRSLCMALTIADERIWSYVVSRSTPYMISDIGYGSK